MKRLLFILLLLSFKSYAQTVSIVAQGFQTLGIGSTTSTTYLASNVYLFTFCVTNAGGTAGSINPSGTGLTFTSIVDFLDGSGTRRLQVFRAKPTSNTTTAISYSYTGTQDGTWVIVSEIAGADITGTNGANAIVQVVTDAQNTTNPTITMASISGSKTVISFFANDANPFSATPESGWTEDVDNGYSVPNTGGYMMHRLTTTDNTPTLTAASSNWMGVAIEIKPPSSARRIFIQ